MLKEQMVCPVLGCAGPVGRGIPVSQVRNEQVGL